MVGCTVLSDHRRRTGRPAAARAGRANTSDTPTTQAGASLSEATDLVVTAFRAARLNEPPAHCVSLAHLCTNAQQVLDLAGYF